jgi:signal transduction histidine kinase
MPLAARGARMIGGVVVKRAASSPILIDWLPVLIVPPVLVCDAALSSDGKPIDALSVLSAIIGCLPLVLRRRVTFPVMAPLLVGGVVLVLWRLHPAGTVVAIPMVALFELALNGDRRRSLWMSVAVAPCVFVSVIPFADGWPDLASVVVRNLALCLLAIAAGDLLRSRRLSTLRMVEVREQATLRRLSEERLQIAREIHDVVAHAMTAINVQAGVAAHLLERDPGQAYDALRHIKLTSGDALSELRATLDALRDPTATRPPDAAPLAPSAGLQDLGSLVGGLRSAGVSVELDVPPIADLPAAVHSAGYRIVQEALTNVARHADASRARVTVRHGDGAVTIEVVDDGAGAQHASADGDGAEVVSGNGLRGMRERAAALGGTLEAAPLGSGGWQVKARLPVLGVRGMAHPAGEGP